MMVQIPAAGCVELDGGPVAVRETQTETRTRTVRDERRTPRSEMSRQRRPLGPQTLPPMHGLACTSMPGTTLYCTTCLEPHYSAVQ